MPKTSALPRLRLRGAVLAALAVLAGPLAMAPDVLGAQQLSTRGRVVRAEQARRVRATARSQAAARTATADRLRADIAWLADDAREGRATGSAGADSAAAYIARRFQALKLVPVVIDEAAEARCGALRTTALPAPARTVAHGPAAGDAAPSYPRCGGFLQRFTARSAAMAHAGQAEGLPTQNVVALLPGSDPALRGQVVVLGAHYDHLGRDRTMSTDPKAGDAIRNGADDNASGTAAVLELARQLAARPPRRSVLFVLFSGEELGLLGSQHFIEHAPVPVDSMVAMLNFDMVGRLTDDKLLVYGTATATELPALLDSANAAGPALKVKGIGDGLGPSDHATFFLKDLPVLHFFTDQHPDYHAATDDVERINAPGTARVVELAHGMARRIADRPARLTFVRAAGTPRMMAGSPGAQQGPRVYLGSVPDMSSDDVPGLKLQGVTPESPADRAGLRAGDVVVELGGRPVTDLYSYTDALYARKPGDVVPIVVLRAAAPGAAPERVTVSVTLGTRGQ
jgi:hypothetical protein